MNHILNTMFYAFLHTVLFFSSGGESMLTETLRCWNLNSVLSTQKGICKVEISQLVRESFSLGMFLLITYITYM